MAGLKLEWSNAQMKGQVNRLKLIKRQMMGEQALIYCDVVFWGCRYRPKLRLPE